MSPPPPNLNNVPYNFIYRRKKYIFVCGASSGRVSFVAFSCLVFTTQTRLALNLGVILLHMSPKCQDYRHVPHRELFKIKEKRGRVVAYTYLCPPVGQPGLQKMFQACLDYIMSPH